MKALFNSLLIALVSITCSSSALAEQDPKPRRQFQIPNFNLKQTCFQGLTLNKIDLFKGHHVRLPKKRGFASEILLLGKDTYQKKKMLFFKLPVKAKYQGEKMKFGVEVNLNKGINYFGAKCFVPIN